MNEYHKINTVFKRDPATNMKTLLIGDYADDAFGYLAGNPWVFTEKVDGTCIRVMVQNGAVTFGGKTDNAQISAVLVRKLEERFLPQRDALLAAFPDGGCLYGEGYGAKVNKGGGNYRQDQDFILFDVLVRTVAVDTGDVSEWWLRRHDIEDVAGKFGLDVVPIIGRGTLHDMVAMARDGFQSTWGSFMAEGIVARPAVELKTRNGNRIITKIKHKDFARQPAAVTQTCAGI